MSGHWVPSCGQRWRQRWRSGGCTACDAWRGQSSSSSSPGPQPAHTQCNGYLWAQGVCVCVLHMNNSWQHLNNRRHWAADSHPFHSLSWLGHCSPQEQAVTLPSLWTNLSPLTGYCHCLQLLALSVTSMLITGHNTRQHSHTKLFPPTASFIFTSQPGCKHFSCFYCRGGLCEKEC